MRMLFVENKIRCRRNEMKNLSTREFLARWLVVNFVSIFLGTVLFFSVSNLFPPNEPLHKGIAGSILGLGFGIGQWLLMRNHMINSGRWILFTFLGFTVAGASVGFGTTEELAIRGLITETVGFIVGASVGLFQWAALFSIVKNAYLWIPATTIAFGLGWLLMWSIDLGYAYEDPMGLFIGMLFLLIPLVGITGLTLRWLLNSRLD